MAITTRDGLIAAIGAGQEIEFIKSSLTSTSGRYMSLFRIAGRPGAAATPGSVAGNVCTSATLGALPFTNPVSPALSYLAQLGLSSTAVGSMIMYDRLVEGAGISANVAGSQTVNSTALPSRAGSGVGVAMWLEIYSAVGATAATVTATYTNSAGVTGRTATLIGGLPASAIANTMIPFALQAGDVGVQSVQSISLSVATGTAGSIGITLLQRLAEIPTLANSSVILPWADLGLPPIKNDACLAMMFLPSGTATPVLVGSATIAQG